MSKALDTGFKRIQFTPDLLPSDLVGTKIYNPSK
jgi:MoxR-like ATPase